MGSGHGGHPAQKVMAGKAIEPDCAAKAAERERATLKQYQKPLRANDLSGEKPSSKGQTRDQVAQAVDFGSGSQYERAKKDIDTVVA